MSGYCVLNMYAENPLVLVALACLYKTWSIWYVSYLCEPSAEMIRAFGAAITFPTRGYRHHHEALANKERKCTMP